MSCGQRQQNIDIYSKAIGMRGLYGVEDAGISHQGSRFDITRVNFA